MTQSSQSLYRTRNTLPESVRCQSVALLNRHLATAIDLKTQAKQAHWNVKGPNFMALHELFDKVADAADDYADLLAERVTTLGGIAAGTARVAAEGSILAPYPMQASGWRQHTEALSEALAAFGTVVRQAIDETAVFGDADTADLFTEISRGVDKNLWLVEAHLHD